jgi:3-deoxy-D-manno-octulosonate 8-phosphate phosphatase (KDO 8-P phosphatase)
VKYKLDETIKAKAEKIKLLLLDVDGVLTDGTVWYGPEGELVKPFNVKDGSSLVWLKRAGIDVGILTGRSSPQVEIRAKELGIELVIQGAVIKLPIFEHYLQESGTDPETIAYMGDDLHDITILKRVGLAMAPADGVDAVKDVCDWVSQHPGGHGAVREAAELILKATGKWDDVTARYRE